MSASARRTPWTRRVASAPIRFYRRYLSRLKPPMCRFSPTCSEYAVVALEERGLLVGTALALWRILRCNPLCKGGYDPVPGTDPLGLHRRHGAARESEPDAKVEPERAERENPRR